LILGGLLGAGCATTTTRIAPVSPERVREEEARQRTIVLRELSREQSRLDSLAYPLQLAGADLCGEKTGAVWGFRAETADTHEGPWRAAAVAVGLRPRVTVTSVVTGSAAEGAGLRAGDALTAVNGMTLPDGREGAKRLAQVLSASPASLLLAYERDGARASLRIEPDRGCAMPAIVVAKGDINAYADGTNVIFPWAMMRFANDAELRVMLSHEIAHNAMRHIEARKSNAILGALLGALGDIALASQGVNTGGAYTSEFAALGARAFSQDFEREADYVGLYILARSDIPLGDAPMLWRHFAQIDPTAIAFASTHPTTAERFVRLEATVAEIERKRAAGVALMPERKDGVR
jgi:hypothetical protein